jgi:hypothetical protein
VAFTITRGGNDPAETGTGATGAPAEVDPLAAYAFSFAVPTLNADARLSFTIDLAALDASTRAALLAAIDSGSATIVTKADDPGSVYGAFARCTGTQTPEGNGCVAVTLLAADGSVAAPGSEPAFARFDGIAGHFSTYAAALVSAKPGGGGPPPTGARPTVAQIRASLRKQIVPHGKAAKIGALLGHRGYRLPFQSLVAGTAKVEWYALPKRARPFLVASGHRSFDAAGKATIRIKLKPAGRRQLRRSKRLHLVAKGMFTPNPDPPVTASRGFSLRR